jgi:hypothetical protein
MRKIGLTIAAAAAVLTSFVAPANAGCKSVTKIFESGSRTVTQKTKVCDNSGSEANDSQGGKGSSSQGNGSQSGNGSASQGNGSPNSRRVIILLRPVPVRPIFVRRVFVGPVL